MLDPWSGCSMLQYVAVPRWPTSWLGALQPSQREGPRSIGRFLMGGAGSLSASADTKVTRMKYGSRMKPDGNQN